MRSSTRWGVGKSPESFAWANMIQRCTNPDHPKYYLYGGRGIKICEQWLTPYQFLIDVGKRPSPEHTLERIDNDGDYEPGNVKWATQKEQMANQKSSTHDPRYGNIEPGIYLRPKGFYVRHRTGGDDSQSGPFETIEEARKHRF